MSTRKIVFLAMMIAASIVLSIVETALSSFLFAFPGIKLGLANIATLVVIYTVGRKEGTIVAVIRIFLVGLLYTGLFSQSFWISLGGGLMALLVMILLCKSKLSIFTVSVLASLMHMVGQIAIVIFILNTTSLIYYLPYMMIMSVPTGIITGYLSKRIITLFSEKIRSY